MVSEENVNKLVCSMLQAEVIIRSDNIIYQSDPFVIISSGEDFI